MSDIITTVRPVTLSLSEIRENLAMYRTSYTDTSTPWRGTDSTSWNNNPDGGRTFYSHLALYVNAGLSSHIVDEALIENDQRDAIRHNELYSQLASVDALMAPVVVEVVQFDQDTEAALRQAELLGATADQRAKLRAIVTARFTAVQERNAMETALTEALRASRNWQTQATEDITDPSDKRVWGIFGNAAMESKRQGYCSVYDQISEAVGIPTRDTLDGAGYMQPSRYDVEVEVTITRRVTVTVDADSYDAAIRAGDDMSHRDIWDYLSGSEWSHYDISDTDAKDASEVDE